MGLFPVYLVATESGLSGLIWESGLALLMAFIIGLLWSTWRINQAKTGLMAEVTKTGIFGLVTYVGPLALAEWNIEEVGAQVGFFWVLGFSLSFVLAYFRIADGLAGAASGMPKEDRRKIKKYVKSNLLRKPVNEIEHGVESKIVTINKSRLRKCEQQHQCFLHGVERLHDYIHSARDEAANYITGYVDLLNRFERELDLDSWASEVRKLRRQYLRAVLSNLILIFRELVAEKHEIWVAIRMINTIQSDGRIYETLIREPAAYDNREDTSHGIGEDEGLPKYLRQQMKKGKPILIFNHNKSQKPKRRRPKTQWKPCENDDWEQDHSAIVAPICRKLSPDERKHAEGDREVAMIMFVNSPDCDVFDVSHVAFAKCCSDMLSTVFFSALPKVTVKNNA